MPEAVTHESAPAYRVEAPDDIGRVAAHLGLAPGRWPTRREYDDSCESLELRHRADEIAQLWNGRWRVTSLGLV
jgi:hypothetical protein